ncbi:MAG: PIG-L family deacetylase [Deinococcus sp.]|nr:PIG-L family deacetylase [Deinococcus sp.]
MAKQEHILAVGGHQGDMELTCGAVIAKYTSAGHKATFLSLTPGEKGHPTLPPDKYREQKMAEGREVARLLGAKALFLPYPDAELPVNEEVQYAIADVIRQVKPTILITHWSGSFHPDHRAAHHNVIGSLLKAGLKWIQRQRPAHGVGKVFFAENWEDAEGFVTELYVDVSTSFKTWAEAIKHMAFARGETGFPYVDYYTSLARARGAETGCQYAQAFMPYRYARRQRVEYL